MGSLQLIQPNVESFIVGRQSNTNQTDQPQNNVQCTGIYISIYLMVVPTHKTIHYAPLHIIIIVSMWTVEPGVIIKSKAIILFVLVYVFLHLFYANKWFHSFILSALYVYCMYYLYLTYERPATSFNTDNRCVDGCDKRAANFVFRTLSHNQLNWTHL